MTLAARNLARSNPTVLDPRTLGRPTHLLDRFAAGVKEDLSDLFRSWLNRRYRADFQVGELSLGRAGDAPPETRWLACAGEHGVIGCAIDRSLVLGVLAYRYGLPPAPGQGAQGDAPPEPTPETATEERLAAVLHQRLVNALAQRIEVGLSGLPKGTPPTLDYGIDAIAPAAGAWCLSAEVSERSQGIVSAIRFALDEGWMAHLLRRLAPRKAAPAALPDAPFEPLAARLQLRLVARLLQKDLLLGDVMDLRVGDVIPVSLGATDVLVDEAALFTATVAEHRGKLCLTGFEDLE